MLLGSDLRARRLADLLQVDGEAQVQGFLDDEPSPVDREALGTRYLGKLQDLFRVASESPIGHVVFALPRSSLAGEATANVIGTCNLLGIDVIFPLDLFETQNAHVVLDQFGPVPVLRVSRNRHATWKLALKRCLDIAGSLAVLLLTWPLWVLAALAIKYDSKGPVFFVQTRCGRFGRPFPCLKFRTMVDGADKVRPTLQLHNEQAGPVFKIRNDPRITRVGRLLRRYSIDELPQLVNVLAGHMSLVGPRPPIPEEVTQYEIDQRARLSMRPGMTCIWQISGRSEIGFAEWMRLDMDYIDRWSLLLDLQILLLTIPAVISARGAS